MMPKRAREQTPGTPDQGPAAPVERAGAEAKSDSEALVAYGKVLKPRGTQGELKVLLLCSGPEHFAECIAREDVLAWSSPAGQGSAKPPLAEAARRLRLESVRFHAGFALVKIDGIDSIDEAETLRGFCFGLPVDQLPAPEENAWYYHQLEGLRIVTVAGEKLGAVLRVEENPAHDMLVVAPFASGKRPFRVPLIDAFVKKVDPAGGVIEVDLPEGLIESQY